MRKIIEFAVFHSRMILFLLAVVLLSGSFAFLNIAKEASPDIQIPIIYVSMNHEGISPEDAERLLVKPMERELKSVEGVKEMRSAAYLGGGYVMLEFEAGFNPDKAIDDIRAKVDITKSELPDDTDEPKVREINLSLFPILVVNLSGDAPERQLMKITKDLKEKIESISSVLRADIAGGRDEQVEIIIDPRKVESYGLSASKIISLIGNSNVLVAAGIIDKDQGSFAIKVPGIFEDTSDILEMPIQVQGDAVVTVGDIADVRQNFKDPEGFARVKGGNAVAIEISKRTGQNIIETTNEVKQLVDQEAKNWPANIKVDYTQDKSENIRNMLADLTNSVILAVLLVMVVIVSILGFRSSLMIGIAVPGSFLAGILSLYLLGMTINVVVLFSLILAVGMLVDGAIVVTEFADRRMVQGVARKLAYIDASERMSWPIIASTMTTLSAFFPLLFWPGVTGEFMKFLPFTLIMILSASMLMALIFIPTIGSHVGSPGQRSINIRKMISAGETGNFQNLEGIVGTYIKVLNKALLHPGKILLASVATLILVQFAYIVFGKGIEFFPDIEPDYAVIQVHARGNLSIKEKDILMREIENKIIYMEELKSIYTRTGVSKQSRDGAEDIIGSIQLEFVDWNIRRPAGEIISEVMNRTKNLAGIKIEILKKKRGPPIGKDIQIKVTSKSYKKIEHAVKKIVNQFDKIGGITNVDDGLDVPGIEWEFEVNRSQAAKFNVDIVTIGNAIKLVTNGLKFSSYRPDESIDEIDIVARFPQENRNLQELDRIRIQTDSENIPVSNFVKKKAKLKVGTIKRTDTLRAITIKANAEEGVLADNKVQEIKNYLQNTPLDPGVNIAFKGQDEKRKESQSFLIKAFLAALCLILIILVTQFNSFYSAVLILSAVVMSTIGVMIGLLITGKPFGIVMNGIGVIALAGIVVNNNIILIDTYDRIVKEIKKSKDAILRSAAQRLRPVLLTTVTTVLGLIPMMLGVNIDFISRQVSIGSPSMQWWSQLSTSIVFGLIFATILTLIVTPCALMVKGNVRKFLQKKGGSLARLAQKRS
ncbi:MAG: efflux RND transporter permease subunit [Alphaproteobacteria bacterium]|nr:efflux RND transporter permease subunit [Alphaproteobacteria bacterium]